MGALRHACPVCLIASSRNARSPNHTGLWPLQDFMTFRSRHALLLPLAIAAVPVPGVLAQNTTGSVSGTVTDASGAIVPGASVTVQNVDTGVASSAQANGDGVYSVRFLPIGRYKVIVGAPGFQTQTTSVFTLEINQVTKIDGKLQPGNVQSTIEVNTDAPILNTNDSSLGVTLSTQEIQNLPLDGRNFSSATLYQPGAVITDPTGLTGNNAIERETYNSGTVSLNGNRTQANYYTLDGADQNEPQNNLIAYNPAPDSIDQIRVISANPSAQYGNANGGQVVSILKSGTDQFHGSVYGYLQNQNLNANSWANKHQPAITGPGGALIANPIARNPYTQTIFGGTFGGPILHNRLFFFVDYEGTRRHTGGTATASVLPVAFRTGDLSSLLALGSGNNIQLYDTQNNFTPYANNQIPVLNPVAKYLFAHPELYPLPNAAPTAGIFANNYRGAQRSFVINNQGDIKISYNKGNRDKFTAFYGQSTATDKQTALLPVFFPAVQVYPTKLGAGSWVHTFSPAIVNEARFGFTRVRWDNNVPTDPSGEFGLTGNAKVGIPFGTQQYVGFSGQSIAGDASYIGTPANVQILRDNTFNYYDNFTIQKGKHLLSTGVQLTRYQQNYINVLNFGSLGTFTYTGAYTGLADGGGYGPADFLLDRVHETQLASGVGLVGNRQWRDAGYLQDDWKVSSKLTLNLGVRYEYDQPWYEVNNKTANVILNTGVVEYAGSIPAGAPAGSVLCPTRACYNANYTQIMPRVGFAYQVAPRLVIRGGYGATSFFEGDASNQRLTSSPPFAQGSDLKANTPSISDNGKPNGGSPYSVETGFNPVFTTQNTQFSAWPQNQQPAYIHNYNLTTEYALTHSTSLQLTYVGESGHHLADPRYGTQLTIQQARDIANLPTGAPIPLADQSPYANLGSVLITESAAMMNYNAGQVTLNQRSSHGLDFTFNYSYARAMTNSAGNYGVPNITGSNGAFQDGYNSRADYGSAGQDVRHNLNGVIVYALPVGRGQAFGAHLNPVLDLLVGGWRGSATIVAYSGLPVTINSNDLSNTGTLGQIRANFYRHIRVRNRSVNQWFGNDTTVYSPEILQSTDANGNVTTQTVNACNRPEAQSFGCAYGPTPSLSFGTASIGSERAPGYLNSDAAAFKDFHITERQALGFRADFYNMFNVASYGNPDSNINDATFGQISGIRGQERHIEFSANYHF